MSAYGTPGFGPSPMPDYSNPVYTYYPNGTYQMSKCTVKRTNGAQVEEQEVYCGSPFFLDTKELSKVFRQKEGRIFDLERCHNWALWEDVYLQRRQEIFDDGQGTSFRVSCLRDLPKEYGVNASVKVWSLAKTWTLPVALFSIQYLFNRKCKNLAVFSKPVVFSYSLGDATSSAINSCALMSLSNACTKTEAILNDPHRDLLKERVPHIFNTHIPLNVGDPILSSVPKCITNRDFPVLYPLVFRYDGEFFRYYDAMNIAPVKERLIMPLRVPNRPLYTCNIQAANFREQFSLNPILCDAIFFRLFVIRAQRALIEFPEAKTASLIPQPPLPPEMPAVPTTTTTTVVTTPTPSGLEKNVLKTQEEKK